MTQLFFLFPAQTFFLILCFIKAECENQAGSTSTSKSEQKTNLSQGFSLVKHSYNHTNQKCPQLVLSRSQTCNILCKNVLVLTLNPSDKKDQVPVDLGTVYELVNVVGVNGLSGRQTPCADAITCCQNKNPMKTTRNKIKWINKCLLLIHLSFHFLQGWAEWFW